MDDVLRAIRTAPVASRDDCLTNYPGRRRFATPGEARAAERGFADFPRFIEEGIAAYRTGWLDAERREQEREWPVCNVVVTED